MQDQLQAIRNRVQECIQRAEALFNIKLPAVDIRFDLRGRASGMAGYRGTHFYLRFNVEHIRLGGRTLENMIKDTVPHEVAHTVCQAYPQFGHRHDAGWRRVCLALGGNGQRCYTEEDAPEAVAASRPYVYITTTGHEVRVTKIIHGKIQSGHGYIMRGGRGKVNRECQYSYMAAPARTEALRPVIVRNTEPAQVAPTKPAGGPSNASQIRARIQQAKARNESAEAVIKFGVEVLGMTAALAKTYVKNNWSKV